MRHVLALCVAFASAHTIPSFRDAMDYDIVLLAEQEAASAIPAHMRLNPKIYESAEDARIAAENELRNMGEVVDTPNHITEKAVNEALSMAAATANDPYHSDVEGIKVDLGNTGDYAVAEVAVQKTAEAVPKADKVQELVPDAKKAPAAVKPKIHADTQNEQIRSQSSTDDVPVVKHTKKALEHDIKPVQEVIPDGAANLIDDENVASGRGSRPQAYGYGSPMFNRQSSSHQIYPFHNFLANAQPLMAPDADSQARPSEAMLRFPYPQYQNMFPGVVQAPPQTAGWMSGAVPAAQSMQPMALPFANVFKQMPQMPAATVPNMQMPMLQAPAPAQNMWTPPDMSQIMQAMPQMLPQMMQAVPQMMNQISQSMMHQMPQIPQQPMPQAVQMQTLPDLSTFQQGLKVNNFEEEKHHAHAAHHRRIHKKKQHM